MRGAVALLLIAACGGTHAAPASGSVGAPPPPEDAGTSSTPDADAGTLPATDAGTPADAGTTRTVPAAGSLYHGVLPAGDLGQTDDFGTDASEQALDTYEQAAGRKVAYVYFSDEWMFGRTFPAKTVQWIRARGAVPFIRLMMRSRREPLHTDPVFTLDAIIAGQFDGDLAAWAQAARDSGGPLVVEYGTEVNGDWNPWSAPYNGGLGAGPAKFQQAYRHIVQVMRGAGASNITWALHYNSQPFPQDPRNVPSAYYPGDDVVDWVGISAYGSERSTDHRCNSFRSLVDGILPQLPQNKPLFIFEFGNTSTNAACPAGPWVQAALQDLIGGRWPQLRGFAWWQQHWNDDGAKGSDMLIEDDPGTQSAFEKALASPAVIDAPVFH